MRRLMLVGSTVSTLALALALSATAASASTGHQIARARLAAALTAGGRNDYLGSDSCTSSAFCMAVGGYSLNGHTPALSEMFSGGNWVAEPVPSPSRGGNIFANEVSCASQANCLFVGDHWARTRGATANLAEAWNGSAWRIVTAAGPAGTPTSGLDDVACPTTTFCLVIGWAGTARHFQDAAYAWKNSTTWRRIAVPRPGRARNSELGGLACFDSRNCMAVGNYTSASGRNVPFAARWHDGQWKLLATPQVPRQRFTDFQGISCPAAKQCIAVGNTEDNTRGKLYHAFAEVWTGRKWHISTLRRAASAFIGASCPARNRCFASGYTFSAGGSFARPLVESWNGRVWTTQHPVQTSAPNPGDTLQHVSCATKSRCAAVGFSYDPSVSKSDRTLAEIWNGHDWRLQSTPNP
ncbi:MAG TPA: hypothetical protein VGH53_25835 [Streptosporangiaceae bacterium]